MAKEKQFVKEITSMEEDFAQWFTDICIKAELVDYSTVKGFYIMRPYGQALWENITHILDKKFKETGHENVAMPLLIPESLLQKEKDHVEGFAPEVAWVTFGGSEQLEERLCVRPTSETLFCDHWAHILQTYKQLPLKYNQWCSVVRWEKTTRPFLRGREFFWQEGHTIHETPEEAMAETMQMLDIYADTVENQLMIPVIKGQKTESEKFAGAEATYTIEAMMHDGKALQSATSHYFGDGFARSFDVTFADRNNGISYPFQTSWGLSTRIIGALIMTHGDDFGLVMPPAVAPIQIAIVPIAQHKEGVLEKAEELRKRLAENYRVKLDDSDNSAGWKFNQYEMKGVPLRLEIGPKDIENGQCVLVRRDNREKTFVKFDELEKEIDRLLGEYAKAIYDKAKANLVARTEYLDRMEDIIASSKDHDGFISTLWCGDERCEDAMKEQAGLSSRCMPFGRQDNIDGVCPVCGKKAKHRVIWGKAY
ncbi:MAG: proline--tRNA ligase [Oscillospiraceae bacterium]|nr:proline--tRNA ligase [Oscillospiraceae bacterium]